MPTKTISHPRKSVRVVVILVGKKTRLEDEGQ